MAYLVAMLHSLVDGLEMRNRCCQKDGVTFRFIYLMYNHSKVCRMNFDYIVI
jgi:hypothetical protein